MCGKHVFVEKPLADSSEKASELTRIGHFARRTLMTGHTFIYSPPVVKVKELIDSGTLGALRYVSFSRVNLGLYQKDVDVIWDLTGCRLPVVPVSLRSDRFLRGELAGAAKDATNLCNRLGQDGCLRRS
jgi:hypothetical protein